ncbi:MAG TPA: alpha/beta fold hydrolase, partial [Candidatus Limnocylindrales bacterium]
EAWSTYSERGRELVTALRRDRSTARPAVLQRFDEYGRDPGSELRFVDQLVASVPLDQLPLDVRKMTDRHHRAVFEASFAEGARQGAVGLADDVIAMSLPWGFSTTEIAVPTTIWWGEHDQLVPRFHSEYLARSIPNARLRILPDAGHGLVETHWDAVLTDLLGS